MSGKNYLKNTKMSNVINDNLLEKFFQKYLDLGYTDKEAEVKANNDFWETLNV